MAFGLSICFCTFQVSYVSAQDFLRSKKVSKKRNLITLDTTFLFEASIDSYTFSDQIMERRGLLLYKPVSLNSYKSFYCVFRLNKNQITSKKLPKEESFNFNKDKKSVLKLNLDLELSDSLSVSSIINLQPYCGTRYAPHKLKLDLLYLGKLPHRVPLFLDCDGYDRYLKKHHNRNYKLKKLRTFLIVKSY